MSQMHDGFDRWTFRQRARFLVSFALLFYISAIFVLAVWPVDEVTWLRILTGIFCILAGIGLVSHALPYIHLPYDDYAYLVVGWVGVTTLGMYLVTTHDPKSTRVALTLILLSGCVGAYGAFLAQTERDQLEERQRKRRG